MQAPDPQFQAFYEKLVKNLNAAYRKLVDKALSSLQNSPVDSVSMRDTFRKSSATKTLGDLDILALVFIVMMEAAKSAQEDVKAIMDHIKEINKEKQAIRDRISEQQSINKADFGRAYKSGKNIPQTEIDELMQLQLQMAMERMSHMYTTISNIMKKLHDTTQSIIDNLK